MLERAIKFQSELMVLSIETMKEVADLTLRRNFSQARLKRLSDEYKASDTARAPGAGE